jgi:hypothetical protein
MRKRIEAVERRLDDIEKTVSALRTFIVHSGMSHGMNTGEHSAVQESTVPSPTGAVAGKETGAADTRPDIKASKGETPGLLHNSLGEPYSIKLVYPTFFRSLDVGIPYCTVSFPAGKERLAKQVREGTLFFIYITSPVRKVIGLAQAMGPAEFRGDVTPSRPWVIPMEWMIGPKAGGVSLSDVGLEVHARPGDSVYAIPEDAAKRLAEALVPLPDLDEAEVNRLRGRFGLDTARTAAGGGGSRP